MKKIFFYLPFVLGITFYGLMLIIDGFSVEPLAWFCLADLFLCGYLLSKNQAWSAFLGVMVGLIYIYLSFYGSSSLVSFELPTGIILCMYYIVCGFWVYKDNKENN